MNQPIEISGFDKAFTALVVGGDNDHVSLFRGFERKGQKAGFQRIIFLFFLFF